MAFLVATTSLPAVYRPNGYARTTTAGTPHARANCCKEKAKIAKEKIQRDDGEKITLQKLQDFGRISVLIDMMM